MTRPILLREPVQPPAPSHQTFEAMAAVVADLHRSTLIRIATVAITTLEERDGDPAFAVANRNCLVTALAACSVLIERGPEVVS